MIKFIKEFVKYKDLFFELIKKDIKLKYRYSILGIFWSMLNPLLMMLVLSIVFSAVFQNEIANFPVYVLIGRIIYQFFSESTNFAMESIYSNGQLIRKVYVPKYLFPLSRVCSSFVITLISLVPLLIVMIVTDIDFHLTTLLFFVPLIYLFMISVGTGLLLSAVTVFFRDIKHFYSIVLLVLMYMTPIFYPAEIIPEKYSLLIQFNPLFNIVEMFRNIVMHGIMPSFTTHLICLGYGLGYILVGIYAFRKTKDKFIFHI